MIVTAFPILVDLQNLRPMKQLFVFLTLIAVFSVNAQTNTTTFRSTTEQTALLELYTSEGCSSCPPAEAWLSGLKESPGLWKSFVPLAFHVDYWDYLGWRDPWAARLYSDRQRAYAGRWHSESIYTPGFVLDGKEWRGWPGRKDVPKAPSEGGRAHRPFFRDQSLAGELRDREYERRQLRSSRRPAGLWFEF